MAQKKRTELQQRDAEFLQKLVIGIGELSETTGISMERIRYLEKAGAIECVPGTRSSTRRFDYQNIRRMLDIEDLVNAGYTLKGSVAHLDNSENPEPKSPKATRHAR
jgi:DNA-binding transcriptional MerR regulator